jgi:hemerythrin-like domain-containing protein
MQRRERKPREKKPTAAGPALCPAPDPIAVIEEEHALQLELCELLECMADRLPEPVDPRLAGVAVTILRSGLPQHMRLEEDVLFPLMRRRICGQAQLAAMLDRLTSEHDVDESLAGEIADTLQSMADGHGPDNAEMIGYMLRGFFESQRRHIAWENEVVLPLARQILLEEDLGELQARIMEMRRPICTRQSLTAIRLGGRAASVCGTCAAGARPSAPPAAGTPPRLRN